MGKLFFKFKTQSIVDYVLDMLFKYLDVFAQYLGPIMVFMVIMLITWIVAIFYCYFIPEIFVTQTPFYTFLYLLYGHYLLVMIIYYYYKAWKTSPGNSGKLGVMPNFKNCKKCLNVKPERAHHCSLCKTCILKMDHHCPWLNTCIGHWNHRFFYLFMMFTTAGCSYVFYIVFPYFNQYIILDSPLFGKYIPKFFNATHSFHQPHLDRLLKLKFNETEITGELLRNSDLMKNILVIQFVLPFAVTFSLTLLLLWHSFLISRGETSIEYHINRSAKAELYKSTNEQVKYQNPYDCGFLNNWFIFFGINNIWDVVWNILLPDLRSTKVHKSSIGDGWQWNKTYMLRELRDGQNQPSNLNFWARLIKKLKTFLTLHKHNDSFIFKYQALKIV